MTESIYVSGRERVLDAADRIVLTTDLDGRITYVNRDFLRISGHDMDEVIGASQAILRHPEMPREPFADLMSTVRAGRAWSGLMKNRCKNGDHYWVRIDAAPLFADGRVAGFTSIRTRPDRAEVEQADRAYRRMAQGGAGIGIAGGRLVEGRGVRRRGPWSLRARLALYAGGLVALAGLQASAGAAPAGSWGWTVLPLTVLWAAAGAVLLYRGIMAPLRRMRLEIELISSGDLSRRLPVDQAAEMSSLAHGLRIVQINMKLLLVRILEATGVVVDGVRDIAQGSDELSRRAGVQAGSLEETAASIEQLAGTVRLNADNARQAAELADGLQSLVGRGQSSMDEVVRTMDGIQQEARRIADISGVIDGIAFQTSILALNASVEAARAGEQGRGFAVVAGEVRALAQRAAEASREIGSRISASVQAIDGGSRQVEQAGQVSAGIRDAADRFAALVRDIALASREQEQGIGEASLAVGRIDQASRSSADLVARTARAAEHIRGQAEALETVVDSFSLFESSPPDRLRAPSPGSGPAWPVASAS